VKENEQQPLLGPTRLTVDLKIQPKSLWTLGPGVSPVIRKTAHEKKSKGKPSLLNTLTCSVPKLISENTIPPWLKCEMSLMN